MHAHRRSSCASCRRLRWSVPEGFADRVLLSRQLTGERQRRGPGLRYGWIALAAAAALVVAVGLFRRENAVARPLPELVIEHVTGEERDALKLRVPVSRRGRRSARVAPIARRASGHPMLLGTVSYVHKCPVGEYRTVHMVMPRDKWPAGQRHIRRSRATTRRSVTRNFERGALRGREEVPIADGTLVMLAESTGSFDALEHTRRDALEGQAETAAGSR